MMAIFLIFWVQNVGGYSACVCLHACLCMYVDVSVSSSPSHLAVFEICCLKPAETK